MNGVRYCFPWHYSTLTAETSLCSFCDPSCFSFVCRVGGGGGGGQTNAFQSVTDFSFSPAVDKDRGRGENYSVCVCVERQSRGWELRGEIPRAS